MSGIADAAGLAINRLLAPTGLMLARAAPSQFESWRARIGGPYRTDREVIALARARGQSVGDYLEHEWGSPGRAQQIVERMRGFGAVPHDLQTVCEIGPGSGKYIERLLDIATPARYEIYEIERQRAAWLARTYPVIARPTEGERLSGTADASIQLAHAHGVYASLKIVSCLASFNELARITAPGGCVVFDIICEECLTDDEVTAWLQTPLRYVNFLSKRFVVEYFERRGFSLAGEFRWPLMVFGHSVYLVFCRQRG